MIWTVGGIRSPLPESDLDRNGVSERIHIGVQGPVYTLYVEEPVGSGDGIAVSRVLWSTDAAHAHAGWKAVFLTRTEEGDCLLEYNPEMAQGFCTYQYRVFYIDESGNGVVVDQDRVDFDINFLLENESHSFDPRAIAAFMEKVNGWLAKSEPLLNTHDDLLRTFQKLGRLEDDLWFLDSASDSGFVRDESYSLLQNLLMYQNAMFVEMYTPTVKDLLSEIQAEDFLNTAGADAVELAATLNHAAEQAVYGHAPDTWYDFTFTVLYSTQSWPDSHSLFGEQSITLQANKTDHMVQLTLSGEVTVPFFSDVNPENDSMYLRDAPYTITVHVQDAALCQLVEAYGT